jgi:hypothetical protein
VVVADPTQKLRKLTLTVGAIHCPILLPRGPFAGASVSREL